MNTSIETIVNGVKELEQNLGVISTSTLDGKPESAVVYFTYDESMNIYFTTRKDSRKYGNITQNPAVAFVIYSPQLFKTLQLEGVVSVVEDAHAQGEHYSQLVEFASTGKALPPIDQLGESEIMFLKIETTWVRAGNFEASRTGDVFQEVTK